MRTAEDRAKAAAYMRKWNAANKERISPIKKARARAAYWANPEKPRATHREAAKRRLNEARSLLGGSCRLCGCVDPDLLTFDHTNGGGRQRRKAGEKTGACLAGRLVKDPVFRSDFRLLCWNCQWIARKYGKDGRPQNDPLPVCEIE